MMHTSDELNELIEWLDGTIVSQVQTLKATSHEMRPSDLHRHAEMTASIVIIRNHLAFMLERKKTVSSPEEYQARKRHKVSEYAKSGIAPGLGA